MTQKSYYSLYKKNSVELIIVADEKKLHRIFFGNKKDLPSLRQHFKESEFIEKEISLIRTAKTQLTEYFARKRQKFDLPLKLGGTDFQRKIWSQLSKIPYGKLISYQELSKAIKHPKAVRAAGSANGRNVFPIIIPCHRVIQKSGALGGYSGPKGIKELLISFERSQE